MRNKVGYLRNPRYTFKLIRELSSFAIALYAIYLLIRLYALRYNVTIPTYLDLALALLAMFFALYHSITWLYLLPKLAKGYSNVNSLFILAIVAWAAISFILIYVLI